MTETELPVPVIIVQTVFQYVHIDVLQSVESGIQHQLDSLWKPTGVTLKKIPSLDYDLWIS